MMSSRGVLCVREVIHRLELHDMKSPVVAKLRTAKCRSEQLGLRARVPWGAGPRVVPACRSSVAETPNPDDPSRVAKTRPPSPPSVAGMSPCSAARPRSWQRDDTRAIGCRIPIMISFCVDVFPSTEHSMRPALREILFTDFIARLRGKEGTYHRYGVAD